jgi:cell wall-associated NlpC family hydrolase
MKSDQNRAKSLGWAGGGPIAGPGLVGGPTEDANLIWASKGEWMQPAAAVDYYGEPLMEAIRRRAIPREAFPGYAGGGSVLGKPQKWPFTMDLSKTWIPDDKWLLANTPGLGDGSFKGLSADASVAKLQKWALAQRGKRYLWGAVGPNRYDCSGLVGNLFALATGKPLYHRYMSTADMGAGRHGMVSGPGRKMTIYLGPGHTAANVGGLHAEAYGGNGVPLAIGRIGTRLSYYNKKLHLPGFAGGGPITVDPPRSKRDRMLSFLQYGWPEPPRGVQLADLVKSAQTSFDTGGMLPPGYSSVYNGTGKPEPVLTGQQWQAISDLVQAGNARAGNTYNFEFRDTTLDSSKLRALQDREAVLARQGRPR